MEFDEATPWPPLSATITTKHREWAAWYAGDKAALASIYGHAGPTLRPSTRARDAQYAGGIVGAAARLWWGQPDTSGSTSRGKMHVPVAADIAALSARLLFGQTITIRPADAAAAAVARLDLIVQGNRLDTLLTEAAHVCAGLGGVFLRATWDEGVARHVLVDVVHPTRAIPEFRHGRLRSVTFWEEVHCDGQHVVRHLETHEPGKIRHRLYEGTPDKLGRLVPFDTARYDQLAGITLDRDDEITLPTGLLTAAYVPNRRPAPLWNDDPVGRHLGVADIEGPIDLLDTIDEAWTSWRRDLRHGKARIIAARALLDTHGPGGGTSFDMDREVYEAVNFAQGENATLSQMLTPQQFTIRVEEHERTIRAATLATVQSAGYSGFSFGITDGLGGGATATEVDSRDTNTRETRETKTRYWTPALRDFLTAVGALDAFVFGGTPVGDITVEFPAGDTETPRETAATLQVLAGAQAASVKTRVSMLHPDWDDTAVDEEVAIIYREQGLGVPPPTGAEFLPDSE